MTFNVNNSGKSINLFANNVLIGRTVGSGRIHMNGEVCQFLLTNARKIQIETNTAAILLNTNYINNSPFVFNTGSFAPFTSLNQRLEVSGNIKCNSITISPGSIFKSQLNNNPPIYTISTDSGNNLTIENNIGGFLALNTNGTGRVFVNGTSLDQKMEQVNFLLNELNKPKINFRQNYVALDTIGVNLTNSAVNGSSSQNVFFDIGQQLKIDNPTYFNSIGLIISNFGTISVSTSVRYRHSTTTANAVIYRLTFQIIIETESGVIRYVSPMNGHRTNSNGTVTYNFFSVSGSYVIKYIPIYADCRIRLRTFWFIQTPGATNFLDTYIDVVQH